MIKRIEVPLRSMYQHSSVFEHGRHGLSAANQLPGSIWQLETDFLVYPPSAGGMGFENVLAVAAIFVERHLEGHWLLHFMSLIFTL